MRNKTLITLTIVLSAFGSATAQIASNPPYVLEQAVIAGGGGQNATGGTFALDGTIGQSTAGTNSTGSPFAVKGGFWTAAPLAPTAAAVSVSGRVLTDGGNGLTNARVILTSANGESRTVMTSSFGYFKFDEVSAGETYIVSVISRRYQFAAQAVFVGDQIVNLDFTALNSN